MRGEYSKRPAQAAKVEELPPRARRIPLSGGGEVGVEGTTSACAENTLNELGLL